MSTRVAPALIALVVVVAVLGVLAPGLGAQEPPGTTVPELLVPGSSVPTTVPAAGAPSDPSLATTTTTAVPLGEGGVGITVTASTKVWAIIIALITVAFLIAALTAVYWRHTRPVPPRYVSVDDEDLVEPEPDPLSPDVVDDTAVGDDRSVFA